MISVITVSYNSGLFIRETIESVLAQSYLDFEYIICDDNSGDATWQIVQEFNDARIKAFRNESNLGEYSNRNKGVSLAKGEYLIFIDGDDVMYPHALTVFASYAKQFPECAILIAKDWDYRIKCPYKVEPVDFFRFEFFGSSLLGNFTKLFFKKSIIQEEKFRSNIRTGDSYIQLKIGQTHPVLIVPDGLTWWRRRNGNATQNLFKDTRHFAESTLYCLELLESNCPLPPDEIEIAKINLYGIFLRLIFWSFIKGNFRDGFFFLNSLNIPSKYWSSFFIPRKSNFGNNVLGDNPLHSKLGVQ